MRFFALLALAVSAYAAPCITADQTCTEWINFPGSHSRSLILSDLFTGPRKKNDKIVRALIVIHGTNRDADNYFRNALAARFLGSVLEDTVVIVPRIASNNGRGCSDKLAPNEVSYDCNGDTWRSGGASGKRSEADIFRFSPMRFCASSRRRKRSPI